MHKRLFNIFLIISIAVTLVKLFFILNTYLLADEAYYAMYARYLDWGYIDHGPVVAFLIKLFTLTSETAFTVRLGALICSIILLFALYYFGKIYFNKKTGIAFSLFLSSNVLFHTNSTVITPDVPLNFFLTLSVMAYFIAYHVNKKFIYLGAIFLGLAMLSKITALFTAIGIALYPILIPEKRYWLKEKSYYLSFILAVIIFMPFIIWNFQNDFAFIKYQGEHVTAGGNFSDFLGLWLPLIIIVGPIFYYFSIVSPFRNIINWTNASEPLKYFSIITVFPLCYFLIHSLLSRFELNWTAPVFIGGIFLIGIAFGSNNKNKYFYTQIVYSLILIVVVNIQTFYTYLPISYKSDVTSRYHIYTDLLEKIPEIINKNPELQGLRITSNSYQIPSMVNFYLNPKIEATCLSIGYHNTLYSFIHNQDDLIGKDFLFIKPKYGRPDWMENNFESMEFIMNFEGQRESSPVSKFAIWHLKNYYGK